MKLDVPATAVALPSPTFQSFINDICLTLTAEASFLTPPIQDRLLATPTGDSNVETPNANRGLGVRTPGFPYTPAPWPSHDDASLVDAKTYTSGPTLSTCSWQSGRWSDVTSPSPFILWRMRVGDFSERLAQKLGERSLNFVCSAATRSRDPFVVIPDCHHGLRKPAFTDEDLFKIE